MKTLLVGFACVFMLNGCLSNNYQLSRAELFRLAQSPAEGRGEHVRVLQQAAPTADEVGSEDADGVASEDADDVATVDTEYDGSSSLQSNIEGRYLRGGRGEFGHSGPGHSGSGTGRAGAVRGSPSSGSSHTTTSSGGGGGFGGSDAVSAAILLVAIAGAVGVYAAVVEGRRFDGWARVPADEPVLLVRPGSSQWLPLSALTERDAAYANHAVMVERDENLLRLSRAPLGRQGFAYEFELGSARLNTVSGVRDFGFASRMGFGYFPGQTLGILCGGQVALGQGHDALADGAIFNGRLFAELEYLPIRAARFHAGLYADLGGAWGIQDLADRTHSWSGVYASAGFLAQLDWTTRLALNLRGGIAALPTYPGMNTFGRALVPEMTLGVSVY